MSDTATLLDYQGSISAEVRAELSVAARSAASWDVELMPTSFGAFPKRVQSAREHLRVLEKQLGALPSANPENDPRLTALLDLRANPRMLRSALVGVTPRPKQREYLPLVPLPDGSNEPRVATLSSAFVKATHGEFMAVLFTWFVGEVQKHDPLLLSEVWNLPSFLRFAVLEAMIAEAGRLLERQENGSLVLLQNLFAGMRMIANTDWNSLLEPLILFDATLRQDPTGTYARMEFDTREVYRRRVAIIARHSDCVETKVAEQVLELAQEGSRLPYTDERKHKRCSHVGYYLVDKGIAKLGRRVGFHPPVADRIRGFIRANADDFYITGIELITIAFIAATLFPLLPNHSLSLRMGIAFLLLVMPAMQCAVELVNNSVSAIFDPEPLPKLDFSEGIPAECATLVAVPTLLLNEKQVRELVTDLEVRFLANRDPNLHFALLTDLPDSTSKPHENDSNPLVDLATRLINDLNAKYASARNGGFLFLHRHRIFNVRQGVWMGWERKRGKLLDLNSLLVGEYDAFPIKAGRLDVLGALRYILTLDSDTQLPSGTAARMAGALAHPLNQAIIDPNLRVVVEGYGILQPRIGVSVSSASRSRLAALYSGQSGFDIYTRAISDAYQDLYGEGIFTGKGIYEVAALHAVLNRRFPRNSLLSHDLIEGAYARAGLVTDIELIDDYPSHYSAYTRRKHRWVRGDWQIAQWMFSRVPDESGRKVASPISTTSRWKIFDNLRRSLVEPFTFILFVAGWMGLPGGPLYWTIVVVLLFWFPTVVQFLFGLGRAILSDRDGAVPQALAGSGHAALLALLNLCFLPHQALLVIDAVMRSLVRRFVTGERLLEWETAAQAESHASKVTPVDRYLALMPLIVCILALAVYLLAPSHFAFLVAAPMLFLWCMATVLTAWLNRPPSIQREPLSPGDKEFLRSHALRIWRYFHEFGGERHNYLIPDNVEEAGLFEAARVSPTNVGLLLNARQAACEFGFLTMPEYASLTERSLATIARLEKHRGHLYNWYDTKTCQPLEVNPFVSTVDSGNFVASLYTVVGGTRALLEKPLLGRQLFTALRPHWELMLAQVKLPEPVARLTLPNHTATITDWLAWLPAAAEGFQAASVAAPSNESERWWFMETHRRIEGILTLVRDYLPWLLAEFNPLREVKELGITAKAETFSVEAALEFAERLREKLRPAAEAANANDSLAFHLCALLPNAIRNLGALAESLRRIARDAERMADETEFGFLVNPGRRILSIGYDVRKRTIHDACYDMLASEARIATFLTVARGELPQQSWFKLAREYTHVFGTHVLISWTGTMFEYLMPSLWMRSYAHTLLAENLSAVVQVQQAFARRLSIPWGISESGSAKKDDAGHYHYLAYGVPQIALFFEATAGPVISPYSTFLALRMDPEECLRNLRRMASSGWVGAYGFYEAADFTASTRKGEIVREWMAHHQGMSLLALLNCLCDDAAQQWFHSIPLVQSAELLLHEMPLSKAMLKALMKDFAGVPPKAAEAAA